MPGFVIDRVQIPRQNGGEDLGRSFFGSLLGPLRDSGYPIRDGDPTGRRERFFTRDPFGNRFEFLGEAR
ncbi:MAG TPA: hypothetical protein VFQ67_15950 [Allosphingosinicella sp.]|jgi:hypothetical protein|nr:hypothetical protein [Allosphingosinicella sp.]